MPQGSTKARITAKFFSSNKDFRGENAMSRVQKPVPGHTIGTRFRTLLRAFCACLALVLFIGHAATAAPPNKAVILSINDVYRLKGVNEGASGGLARVRTLRLELERTAPDLLFLHGGDFLAPSFVGRSFKGRQMLDLMNVMDGNPRRGIHDPRMFVVFGNHEFDDSHCKKAGPLPDLVSDSEFTWLGSNLDFRGCAKLTDLHGNPNIAVSRIVRSGGLRIGLYGVILSQPKYADAASDPVETSCAQVAALRAQGVDAVVALTHLNWQMDLELLGLAPGGKKIPDAERACLETPDVIIGGHDHHNMAMPSAAPRLFKADADAVTAWVVEIAKRADGSLDITGELKPLDGDVQPDPMVDRLADQWVARHDERMCMSDCLGTSGGDLKKCLKQVTGGRCLQIELAVTNSLIETEEIQNRSNETGFGNWVADQVREAGGADVAFLNAGGIRLNYDVPAGTVIKRRHLEEMFPFANKLAVRTVTGATLWAAVEHAVAQRGSGPWAHFSGLAVKLASGGGKQVVESIAVRKQDGTVVPITRDSLDEFSVASVSFVLANGDDHGFDLCPDLDDIWACKSRLEDMPNWPLTGPGSDLAGFVQLKLSDLGMDPGLTLSTDGRLCDPGKDGCLIDQWLQ